MQIGRRWIRATIAIWIVLVLAAVATAGTGENPLPLSLLLVPSSAVVLSAPLVGFLWFGRRTSSPEITAATRRRLRVSIVANVLAPALTTVLVGMVMPAAAPVFVGLVAICWITAAQVYRMGKRSGSPAPQQAPTPVLHVTAATIIGVAGLAASAAALAANMVSFRSSSYTENMKEDLRSVARAEDSFFADSTYYAPIARLNVRARLGESIRLILATDNKSWGAIATAEGRPDQCAAWDGAVFPAQLFGTRAGADTLRPEQGVPVCWEPK